MLHVFYPQVSNTFFDKNNFIKVSKAIIIDWANPANHNYVLPGGGAIPQPHQNVKKIYDGYDEISQLLLLNISDKREFVETSRAFAGMVKYICNGDGTWDDKTDRFNKFSSFVKECLAKDNTQEIIDYAKMHLKEFVLVEAAAATNILLLALLIACCCSLVHSIFFAPFLIVVILF